MMGRLQPTGLGGGCGGGEGGSSRDRSCVVEKVGLALARTVCAGMETDFGAQTELASKVAMMKF